MASEQNLYEWLGTDSRGLRATTHYYLVEKRAGTAEEKRAGVRGPMTKEEFEQLAQKLSLPPFAKSFPDLE
ncbi:MAG: hypothetical protein JSR82_00945 [Verrucomicrobia bacterium]|nr:hypothetical protein [Verrucomicrobiota bacterium]